MQFISKSEDDTKAKANEIATQLKGKETLCLYGNLGMGKTLFSRALIRAICNDPDMNVPSPTFSLVQEYETSTSPLFHFDCYRLEDPEEIYELGWEDIIGQSITIIEWPERIAPFLPRKRIEIKFENIENQSTHRAITIEHKE